MTRKCLLITITALAFFMASSLAALELPKQQATAGGVVILQLADGSQVKPDARYNKKKVMVVKKHGKWLAVVGIPLRTPAGQAEITYRLGKGKNWQRKSFTIKGKNYPEQRLTIKNKRKVDPNEEDMKKIRQDNAKIAKAKSSWSEELTSLEMTLPLQGRFSSGFGLQRYFNNKPRRPHGGIDIAAPEGTPIYAPADGKVVEADDFFFSGNCIFIDHGQGLLTFYAHLSKIDVKPGETVTRGEKIGEVGETGRVTGPHLHWSVGLNQTWVDPHLFLP